MWVRMSSGSRSFAMRHHMFVQSEQGWIWCRLNGQMVESVVSLATMSQFLCMMAVSCLPMSEKGIIMGRMLISVCGVCWDNR